jgi:hypothetical protein
MKNHLQEQMQTKTLPINTKTLLTKYSIPQELHQPKDADDEPQWKIVIFCL